MTGADIIAFIILAAIVIAVLAYLLHWLYRRSSKDVSFVRTGLGGEKVVMGGGALVLPIVHEVTDVSMNTLRLEVRRAREQSLITRDRLRVELTVEFSVRVIPKPDSVAAAARTLGHRTMNPESLKDLVQGRFVDAMGAVTAQMTMEEIHEHRPDFIKKIRHLVADTLTEDGLELETVSLTSLDEADMKLFNPSNAFDAEGLTRLTEAIETRRKKRNDIEQDTMIAVRKKNLEAEMLALNIQRDSEYARLEQEREVVFRRSVQRMEIAREKAERERRDGGGADQRLRGDREGADRARTRDRCRARRPASRNWSGSRSSASGRGRSRSGTVRLRVPPSRKNSRRRRGRGGAGVDDRGDRAGRHQPRLGDRRAPEADRADRRGPGVRTRSDQDAHSGRGREDRSQGPRRCRPPHRRRARSTLCGQIGRQAQAQRGGEPALRREPPQCAPSAAGREPAGDHP